METNPNSPEFARKLESTRILATLFIVGTIGVAPFLILPSLILGFVTDLGFNELQIGKISSLQLLGMGLGPLTGIVLLKYLSWKKLAHLGLALLLVAEFACTFTEDFTQLLALRFICGFAGGICVAFAAYAVGQTANTDRNFGSFVTMQVGFAIVANFAFPSVLELAGLDGIFLVLCALELTAIVLVSRFMPSARWQGASQGQGNDRFHWAMCAVVLLGMTFFFTALGGFWAYITPIGIDAGLTSQQTGNAVSIGMFGGLLGAYGAAALNIKIGRVIPLSLALALQLAGLFLLYQNPGYLLFGFATLLFGIGWYISVPYQFALLASFDRDGRPMLLLNAVAGLGSGLGPGLAAAYLLQDGYSLLYILCALFLALALVWHLTAIGLGKKYL